ncbi:kinase-like domain-containing protein [Gigaspora rosea]|uniref:Kinase-like domain-containing protein n=1 Tax=Gigaspora rosea TaxID=44941 RepID=A0A397VQ03_9GLOM|nr:kinase-like domain-containing protein [Gigaspora rosea]
MSSNPYDKSKFDKCIHCKNPKTADSWCNFCSSSYFKEQFSKWTSVLEWVSFDDIFDIEFHAEGGYATVYKAKWKSGPIEDYDIKAKKLCRLCEPKGTDIILKSIKDSKNVNDEFFEEIKLQMRSFVDFGYIIKCYGITKCPAGDNYMMIMEYKEDGSLRNYLDKKFNCLKWDQKLDLIYTMSKGLFEMHEENLVHKDFHSGNIIVSKNQSYITDFGLCKNVNSKAKDGVYGVLPFIAPEVLDGKPYTKAADIYSFGIIMNQVASGHPPYYDIPHDSELAMKIIYRHLRPVIYTNTTPQIIIDLIKRCWSENPENRPKALELRGLLFSYKQTCNQEDSEICKQINTIEKNKNFNIPLTEASLNYETNKQAIYTSRRISFGN